MEKPAFKDPSPQKTTGSASGPFTYLHPSYKVTRTELCPAQLPLPGPTPLCARRALVALLPSL